jgi:trigger factor
MVKARIVISPEEWEKYVEQAYEETKDKYVVEGFRKGKAPRKMIEKTYGSNIFFDEAIDIAFNHEYQQILAKEGVDPIDYPKLKLESFDEKGLVIVAEVETMPEVVLGKYTGLEIEKHEHELEEGRVEKELEQMRQNRARFVTVERQAQMGDVVTIDFVGSVNGVEFEGGKAEDYRLELGSKTFIDNFEEQIVDMQIGQTKDINVTFPENYGATELAGKKATFKVTLTKVEQKELPELDDEFASSVSEVETLEQLKEDIRKNLQASLEQHLKQENENNLLDAIVQNSQVEVPQVLVDRQIELFIKDFETRLSFQGAKLEDYLSWTGSTLEQLKEQQVERAKQTVKTRLVIEKLIEKENLFVTEQEMDAKVKELADKYKKEVADYKKSLGEKQLQYFENQLLMDKVFGFLMANNTFVAPKNPQKHNH